MNSNYKRSFSFGKILDLLKIKEPESLHGPTLIRTSGITPGKAPKRIDISHQRRCSAK